MKSFEISNIVYDANAQELTFKFTVDGLNFNRVSLGVVTDDNVVEDLRKILNQYYAA